MDERTKHGRQLRRLRAAARRWSVLAGTLVGAAAVLTPYDGLGVGDAGWAAAAGGSVVLAGWRWADYLAFAARPVPAADANPVTARVEALLGGVPWGRELVSGLRRHAERSPLRGSAVAPGWARLDRAAAILDNLAPRPGSPAETAMLEAAAAERGLRQLAKRAAGLERGRSYVGHHESFDQFAHRAGLAVRAGRAGLRGSGWCRGGLRGRGGPHDPGPRFAEPPDRSGRSPARHRPGLRRAAAGRPPGGVTGGRHQHPTPRW